MNRTHRQHFGISKKADLKYGSFEQGQSDIAINLFDYYHSIYGTFYQNLNFSFGFPDKLASKKSGAT